MSGKDIRICFIGDSLVQGTGDPLSLGWPGRLLQRLNGHGFVATGYNLGIRRETSEDIKQRWKTEAQRRLPAHGHNHLVFSFGVNDTTRDNGRLRVSLDQSANNLKQILGQAADLYPTLMIGPTPVCEDEQSSRIAEFDLAYRWACEELSVSYLSVFDDLQQAGIWDTEMRGGDGSHPGEGGYRLLSQLVADSPLWWFREG